MAMRWKSFSIAFATQARSLCWTSLIVAAASPTRFVKAVRHYGMGYFDHQQAPCTFTNEKCSVRPFCHKNGLNQNKPIPVCLFSLLWAQSQLAIGLFARKEEGAVDRPWSTANSNHKLQRGAFRRPSVLAASFFVFLSSFISIFFFIYYVASFEHLFISACLFHIILYSFSVYIILRLFMEHS